MGDQHSAPHAHLVVCPLDFAIFVHQEARVAHADATVYTTRLGIPCALDVAPKEARGATVECLVASAQQTRARVD